MQKDDLGEIAIVFRKDILELFRDYRSLLIMVVMPILLYPLFLILPAIVAAKSKPTSHACAILESPWWATMHRC
ncbi:MAG: hypothetical protein R3C24_09220 [Cyanobacteriota/Melainabacteria group bacterium]